MTLESCRKWLIGVWGVGFLIPLILIFIQFGGGKYGNKFFEVFGWLTSLILPTIFLMVGVMVANPTENRENPTIGNTKEIFVFRLAFGISIFYLLIVNLVFFLEPYLNSKPQELLRNSKIVLAAFDSFISLLIGYFFGKK